MAAAAPSPGSSQLGSPTSPTPGQVTSRTNTNATKKDSTPGSTTADKPGHFDFTDELCKALADPRIQQGFFQIFKPMMSKYVEETLAPYQHKIEDLEVDMAVVKDSVSELELKTDSVNNAHSKRIRELERAARYRNLRITGLTPSGESPSLLEKYRQSLTKILEEAAIEGVTANDCSEFVRINNPSPSGSSITVIMKMNSEAVRDKLYYQRSKLKNCSSKHYVNEDLTKQDARIFKRLRQELKSGSLHSCWTKGGLCWAKSAEDSKPFPVYE
jgi:hypothetical protein